MFLCEIVCSVWCVWFRSELKTLLPWRGWATWWVFILFPSPFFFSGFHCRNLVNIHFNQQRKYNLSIFIGRLPKVYWNRNVECMHFPPERVCISRDKPPCRSKSFPSMVADEMQTQSNQSGRYHNPPLKCQSPLSSLCVWWEIIVWENLLILANTLSALICTERIRLY